MDRVEYAKRVNQTLAAVKAAGGGTTQLPGEREKRAA